jgi:hypothetical protein
VPNVAVTVGSAALGRIDNALGFDNDEQGAPIFVCNGPRAPWSQLWPQMKQLADLDSHIRPGQGSMRCCGPGC